MALFELEGVFDRGTRIRPDDILKTKRALRDLGFYRVPSHGLTDFTDDEMFEGLEAFQRERKLSVDGMMIPDGRTERAINSQLKKQAERQREQASAGNSQKSAVASNRAGLGLLRPASTGAVGFAIPASAPFESGGGDDSERRNTQVAANLGLGELIDRLSGRRERGGREREGPSGSTDPRSTQAPVPDPPEGMRWSKDGGTSRRFLIGAQEQ